MTRPIEFQGKEYDLMRIRIKGYGRQLIAYDELEDALFHDGRFVSDEARKINAMIFTFVPNSLKGAQRKQIRKYIESCLYTIPPMDYDETVARYRI